MVAVNYLHFLSFEKSKVSHRVIFGLRSSDFLSTCQDLIVAYAITIDVKIAALGGD